MAIQNRRGTFADFDGGSNLADGEFGIVMSGDSTDDGTGTYICTGNGIVHRILTDDDKTELEGNIATNATNIATNATDIATNATDISTINTTLAQLNTIYTYTYTDSTTNATIHAYRVGHLLQVFIGGNITLPQSTWTVVGTLPENLRPSSNTDYATLVSQNPAYQDVRMLLSVYANGAVRLRSGTALNGVYFNTTTCFLID